MNPCYLCQELEQRKHILWENELLFVAFDTCPVSSGHVLLSPKRHVDDFEKLTKDEFTQIRNAIREITLLIKSTDLVKVYEDMIKENESSQSLWFCKKALARAKMKSFPDGYNHGFNDGKAAGRTVDHFHWHVIPRYEGDIKNSTGGIRFVIPQMGDYQKSR